jgi:hypothetical protein
MSSRGRSRTRVTFLCPKGRAAKCMDLGNGAYPCQNCQQQGELCRIHPEACQTQKAANRDPVVLGQARHDQSDFIAPISCTASRPRPAD